MAWLRENGYPLAERRVKQGNKDRGDVSGVPHVVVECKNCRKMDLPQWLREAEVERKNDKAKVGVVVFPRRSHGVGDGYFLVDIETGFRLLRAALGVEAL